MSTNIWLYDLEINNYETLARVEKCLVHETQGAQHVVVQGGRVKDSMNEGTIKATAVLFCSMKSFHGAIVV